MAKMKTYAVEIEYTVRETIFVEARRPTGAVDKAMTDEAYEEAHRWDDDADHWRNGMTLPKGATCTKVREV